MDRYKSYWYVNDRGIQFTYSEPMVDYVLQTVSSIGIPGMRAIKYEYKDKIYNKVLSVNEADNPSIIYDMCGVK